MAINIGENQNEQVTYVNNPDINRVLFKNLKEGASKEDIVDAVNDWLDEHPEATTVEDGSILPVKLGSTNSASSGYVLSYNATAGKFEWVDVQSDITELKEDFTQLDDKIAATLIINTASGSVASFDDGADNVPVKDLTVQIVPVQSGSGDPSPENIRPISGWTGVNVSRTGKNLLDNGKATSTSSHNINIASKYMKAGTYYLSCEQVGGVSESYNVGLYVRYNKTGNYGRVGSNFLINTKKTWTITNDCYVEAYVQGSNVPTGQVFNVMLSTDPNAVWEESNANTYPIDWTTEAGTVYGGTLDVTTGVLTVIYASATFDGNANWSEASTGKFVVNNSLDTFDQNATDWISNIYPYSGKIGNTSYMNVDGSFYTNLNQNYGYRIAVYDTTYSTLSDFITALSTTPIVVVGKLATPQTYQLTPQEVSTLLGLNNIWADCGDVEVEYRADTKLYIENLTAPSEDDMVANTNIPDATYFMVGNNLFLSTTTIPAGDTINPGTNCTKMDLAAALNAINS